jgi:hypothetical protein
LLPGSCPGRRRPGGWLETSPIRWPQPEVAKPFGDMPIGVVQGSAVLVDTLRAHVRRTLTLPSGGADGDRPTCDFAAREAIMQEMLGRHLSAIRRHSKFATGYRLRFGQTCSAVTQSGPFWRAASGGSGVLWGCLSPRFCAVRIVPVCQQALMVSA